MSQRERRRRRAEKERREARNRFTKAQVAEAVHKAVCDLTRSDGLLKCHYYTYLGGHFLPHLGYHVHWQAGRLLLYPDPSDPELASVFDPELGREERGDYGECHSWLAVPLGPTTADAPPPLDQVALIDFSARHYKRYVEGASALGRGEPCHWRIADPPAFIWERADRWPKWVIPQNIPAVLEYVLDGFDLRGEDNARLGVELVLAHLRGQNVTIAGGD
jgi:hypothetical protein